MKLTFFPFFKYRKQITSLCVLLVLWWLLALIFPGTCPNPTLTLHDFILILIGLIENPVPVPVYYHIFVTLYRVAIVFCAVMGFAILIGVLMGSSNFCESFFETWIVLLYCFPAVIWVFIFLLLFGPVELAPLLALFLIVLPYPVANVWEGVKSLDKNLIAMAKAYGASKMLILRDILIPHLTPAIMAAARIAFSLCLRVSVIVEVVGAAVGIGAMVDYAWDAHDVNLVLAWGIFLLLIYVVGNAIFNYLERKLFIWMPKRGGLR
jgi:NitT/TauT family transport system permease protein